MGCRLCLLLALMLLLRLPAPAAPLELPTPLDTALARGNLEQAEELLANLPEGPRREMARGVLAQLRGDFAEAASHYRSAAAAYPAEAAFRLGNLALRREQPEAAAGHYRQALERAPDHAFAHYNLALALEELGRPEEALQHATRALELDPPEAYTLVRNLVSSRLHSLSVVPVNLLRSRALLLQGRLLRRLGRREEALRALQAAPDLDPSLLPRASRELGRLALDRQDPAEAAVWFQHYLESNVRPTGMSSSLAVWGRGYLRLRGPDGQERYARSLEFAVDREGRLRAGHWRLGVRLPEGAHEVRVDRRGVVRAWVPESLLPRALGRLPLYTAAPGDLEPAGIGLYRLRPGGRVRRAQAGPDGPGEILQGFALAEPGSEEVWRWLEELSPELIRQVRASPFLTRTEQIRVLSRRMESPNWELLARVRLGALYYALYSERGRLEDLAAAISHWRRAAELRPHLEFLAVNLATARLLQGRPEEAVEPLHRLEEANPLRALPRRLQIQAAMAGGRLDEALRRTEEAPGDPFAAYARAEILAARGREEEALEVLERLLQLHPGLVEARYLRVHLLARRGRVGEEMAELERLLNLDPTPYRAQRLLASLLERLGRRERAAELYREYLTSPEPLIYETEEYVKVDQHHGAPRGNPGDLSPQTPHPRP